MSNTYAKIYKTITPKHLLEKAKREGDTLSETILGELEGFTLIYQTWSRMMRGNGISGTIRTSPQSYYVATVNENGSLTFDGLEPKTRNLSSLKVRELFHKKFN